jgi:DNA-directed RNA polymerase subunit omega
VKENKYLLTMMIAKRAKQLQSGSKPLLKSKHNKPILIALEEIKAGKVYLKEVQEPQKSEEKIKESIIEDIEELELDDW